jgi:hypothetical protein
MIGFVSSSELTVSKRQTRPPPSRIRNVPNQRRLQLRKSPRSKNLRRRRPVPLQFSDPPQTRPKRPKQATLRRRLEERVQARIFLLRLSRRPDIGGRSDWWGPCWRYELGVFGDYEERAESDIYSDFEEYKMVA